MKRKRYPFIFAGLLVAVILAFFLQEVVHQAVVIPLTYLWWVLKFLYATVPQLFLWILLLAGLVLITTGSLLSWNTGRGGYERPSKPVQGPVETLAGWVSNTGQGNYHKWVIANRLGKLSQSMDVRSKKPRLKNGWTSTEPPGYEKAKAVSRYLQAGLDELFVDYRLPPFRFMRRRPTPFDLDVKEAVEYLEAQIKDHLENP